MGRPGRPKSSNRIRKEDCGALVIRMLPMLPSSHCAVTNATIAVEGTIEGVRPFSIHLNVIRSKQGWRCECPKCNRHSAVIYFPPDSTEPACRVCLRLVYNSQYDKLPIWAQIMRYQMQQLV